MGYRRHVSKTDGRLGSKGFVENMADGRARTVIEAEGDVMETFLKEINRHCQLKLL